MSEPVPCRFCGGATEPEERGTCDGCWYGMRLEPEEWSARLEAKGRKPIYRGGCIFTDGVVVCRDGFVPALEVIDGGDSK